MGDKNYHQREWLIEHYINQGLSCRKCAIASGYPITPLVIHKWLRKHGIPTRGIGHHMKGDKNPFRGRQPSEETRAKIARSLTGKHRSPESVAKQRASVSGPKSYRFGKERVHGTGAWVVSGDMSAEPIYMRSRWEVYFADWLNRQGIAWEYEPCTFHLADGSAYTPDFLANGVYYEIKGYMTEENARKIAGFRVSYPTLSLEVIDKAGMIARGINPANYTMTTVEVSGSRTRICRTCGTVFIPKDKHQIMCGLACNKRLPYVEKVTLPCAVCGTPFTKYESNTRRTTCSVACGRVLGARKRSGENHWHMRKCL